MPSRDSSTISARLRNEDIKKLKASGYTASQVLKKYIDGGFTPAVEISGFLRACERRKRNPQEVLDMITEQIMEV